MSTIVAETVRRQVGTPAERLRTTTAAVRVSIQWLGTRKTLTLAQKAEAAEPFGAEAKFLSAGKKLLDTTHPAFKDVTAVRGRVIAYWKGISLPYPEPGIRLIRQDRIDDFAAKMREFQEELSEAVETLDRHYSDLKVAARKKTRRVVQRERLPGVPGWPVRRGVRLPVRRAARVLGALEPRPLRGRVPAGAGPVRRCHPIG